MKPIKVKSGLIGMCRLMFAMSEEKMDVGIGFMFFLMGMFAGLIGYLLGFSEIHHDTPLWVEALFWIFGSSMLIMGTFLSITGLSHFTVGLYDIIRRLRWE